MITKSLKIKEIKINYCKYFQEPINGLFLIERFFGICYNFQMTHILQKALKLFGSAFGQTALIEGTSDIMVVRWDSGEYLSTPFVVCFGHKAATAQKTMVKVYINDTLINKVIFSLDKYGYIHPMRPSKETISKMNLNYGKNTIKFQLDNQHSIQSQIYLYREHDKILVSDMDGTLTKDDIGGLYNNLYDQHYLHDGYDSLINTADQNGYKIVWLTMRSLPLYKLSKKYIRNHTKVNGVLLTQPQQFFPAIKKQLLKQTGNIKTNMMLTIRNLFPKENNPFIGGLGNRENDAIAYRAAGIPLEKIFIVDTKSKVHHLGNSKLCISYNQMHKNIEEYFPKMICKNLLDTFAMQTHEKAKRTSRRFIEKNKNWPNTV